MIEPTTRTRRGSSDGPLVMEVEDVDHVHAQGLGDVRKALDIGEQQRKILRRAFQAYLLLIIGSLRDVLRDEPPENAHEIVDHRRKRIERKPEVGDFVVRGSVKSIGVIFWSICIFMMLCVMWPSSGGCA